MRRRSSRRDGGDREPRRHLILAGGGHTHVHVLRALAMAPLPGFVITVVSPSRLAAYSGMVPGTLAGLYGPDEGSIDVAALAARAGARFLEDRVAGVDAGARTVRLEVRGEVPYDLLSLDVGSRPLGAAGVARFDHVVPIKPIEVALPRIRDFAERAVHGSGSAVVVGAGAGGVEVAFALRRLLAGDGRARVTLVEQEEALLPGAVPRLSRVVHRLAERYGIAVRCGVGAVEPEAGGVRLKDGGRVPADIVVWATGAEGLPWLAASGLDCDARGFVLVDDALRCVRYPEVFAAGDCARQASYPWVPRAGVYAVRQGPVLTRNLRATARGRRLVRYRPQPRFLSLLSTGDRRAVAVYGNLVAHGRTWWWLKDRIDRRFVAGYAPPRAGALRPPPPEGGRAGMEMAPCGGCAAKVDARVLGGVLAAASFDGDRSVAIGLDAPDDAAVLRHDGGSDLVVTIDAFPPFLDDPRTVAEVAAVNAASDVFAMGGIPSAALALVSLPPGDARLAASELTQVLDGARRACDAMGIALVGGHSLQGDGRLVGFSVQGRVARDAAWTKGGARPGDRLVLTKPLGTAVILAAARAGECPAAWVEGALELMRTSNAAAAQALREVGIRCCTDVSGFGLAGHLLEVLRASREGAVLRADAVPALPGALELLAAGWRSSAHVATRALLSGALIDPEVVAGAAARLELLCDPQTSGGLLAAVPEAAVPQALAALAAAGVPACVVGEVGGPPGALRIALGSAAVGRAPSQLLGCDPPEQVVANDT